MQPYQNLLFSIDAQVTVTAQQHANRHQACPFPAGNGLFGISGEVNRVVHLIREDLIAVLYPIRVDRPRSCNGNNVRPF